MQEVKLIVVSQHSVVVLEVVIVDTLFLQYRVVQRMENQFKVELIVLMSVNKCKVQEKVVDNQVKEQSVHVLP